MAESQVHRRLAAILAADVAGYSRLMGLDERTTISTLREYREIFRTGIESHGGRVVDMAGDSVLAVFDSAAGAVQSAVETQGKLAMRNEALPEDRRMQFRIGVNLGDIEEAEDGTVYGDGVNVAARLEAMANPGGVNVSGSVFDSVRSKLGLPFDFLGEQEVKNIADPVRAYRVIGEGETAKPTGKRRRILAAAVVIAVGIIVAAVSWWFIGEDTAPGLVIADGKPNYDPVLMLPSGPSIAVLPFANLSGDPDQDYFTDGLTEEIISRLSRFRELLVFARASTQAYKGQAPTPQDVQGDLGAQFMLEGSVRRAGDMLRVHARLVETETGIQRWSETYDRTLADVFAVEDEITDRIVGAIGANYAAVVSSQVAESADQPARNVAAYDLAMRAWMYYDQESVERHARARADAERAAEIEPDSAFVQAVLAFMYLDEVRFNYGPRPDSLDRALAAARRAVDLDRNSAVAQSALAMVQFHRGEFDQFLGGCERVIALNPNAADFVAECGEKMVQMGQIERGEPLLQHARAINPRHAPWYRYPDALIKFDRGDYAAALAAVTVIEEPDFYSQWMYRAALSAAAGRQSDAEAAVAKLLQVDPSWSIARFVDFRVRVWHWPQKRIDQWATLLRQAGLPENRPEATRPVIVVLPFDNLSGDQEQDYFAEGITEDITTRLTRFGDLGVIARNSAFQYQEQAVDVRAVAEALGADYVVEGSVRRSDERVRVTAQLLTGTDGTHIWAETWDRKLSAGDLFDIQDEITNGIVGAIAGVHGAISRTAAAQARQRPESLTSYECVLLAHAYERNISKESWTVAKNCLETVLTREPNYVDALSAYTLIAADAYAMGKTLLGTENSQAWLDKALDAGERAVKLAPEDANSHRQLAFARFVAGDIESFRDHAERALALNPYDANVMGDTGTLLTFSGSYDRGLKLILEAIDLNPHHPEWWNLGVFRAHWMNDRLEEASDALGKIDEPDNFWPALWRTVIAVELEDEEAATVERAELERRYPGFSIAAYRQEAAYWHHTPEFVDRTVAVLRKAGVPESSD